MTSLLVSVLQEQVILLLKMAAVLQQMASVLGSGFTQLHLKRILTSSLFSLSFVDFLLFQLAFLESISVHIHLWYVHSLMYSVCIVLSLLVFSGCFSSVRLIVFDLAFGSLSLRMRLIF